MIEAIALTTESDEAVPGEAALAADADGDAELFQSRLAEAGIVPSTDRGLLLQARQLLDRLLGRRMVEDLGTHSVRAYWLGFHVPPGGSAALTLKSTATHESKVGLKIMGLGGGSGRKIVIEAERDFGTRDHCLHIGVTLDVRLSSWAEDGAREANSLQVDVERKTGDYAEEHLACPLCARAGAGKPLRARPTGQGWDLTGDRKGLTETIRHALEQDSHMQIGLEIPAMSTAIKPSIEMRRTRTSSCTAVYTFPGGAHFEAYRMLGYEFDLPFWVRR